MPIRPTSNHLLLCLALGLVLTASACGVSEPGGPPEFDPYPWETAAPESVGVDPIQLADTRSEAAGLGFLRSLVVVRQGKLVSEDYWQCTERTAWEVRSVTKSVLSALLGIAINRGYVHAPDSTLVHYYADYVTAETDPRLSQVTIRQLLTMTAGIVSDQTSPLDGHYNNLIYTGMQLPLEADPGTAFIYSSLGTHFLSGVLARGAGAQVATFAHPFLFDRLGITLAYWAQDGSGIAYGGTGLGMLPRDMARLGLLYLRNGTLDGEAVIPQPWVQASLATQVGGDWATTTAVDSLGYGYLWWTGKLDGYPIQYAAGHKGQMILLIPDLDVVVVTTASFDDVAVTTRFSGIFGLVRDHLLPAITP